MISYNPATLNQREHVVFFDQYQRHCSLHHSSAVSDQCVWIGLAALNADRMHLNRENVRELLPFLIAFAETGSFKLNFSDAIPIENSIADVMYNAGQETKANSFVAMLSSYIAACLRAHWNAQHLSLPIDDPLRKAGERDVADAFRILTKSFKDVVL